MARCQQQPFYPHVHFHFIMCSAVDTFLLSSPNKVCVDSGRADTWETDPKAPGPRREFVFGLQHKGFLHLMCICPMLRVMKISSVRGEWSNFHVKLLLQPVGLWEPCSIGTLCNNKTKYSSGKNDRQADGAKKFTVNFQSCISSCLWYLTVCTSARQIRDPVPFSFACSSSVTLLVPIL